MPENTESDSEVEIFLRRIATINLLITRTSRWQFLMFIVASSYNIFASSTSLIDYFTTNANYTCAIPENVSKEHAIPILMDGSFHKCEVYADFDINTNVTIPCPMGYTHGLPLHHSIVATFDLHCEREYLKDIPQSMFFVGAAIGALVVATMGDKYGKRPIALIGYWMNLGCGFGCAMANSIFLFAFFRFLSGICFEMCGLTSYILSVELFSAENRGVPCIAANFLWITGMFLLDLCAYYVRSWRLLYFTVYTPIAITISYYWLLNESLFWLSVKGRREKINSILKQAYKINRTPENDRIYLDDYQRHDSMSEMLEEENHYAHSSSCSNGLYNTFQSTRKFIMEMFSFSPFVYTMVCGCVFMSFASFSYFGTTFSAAVFSSNIYLHFCITAVVEIPGILASSSSTEFFTRKFLISFCNLIVAIVCIIFAFIPDRMNVTLNVFNHILKVFTAVNADYLWIYVPELFPTRYRQFGLGLSITCGRIITSVSPYLNEELARRRLATLWIIGSFAVLIVVMSVFLPETKHFTMTELTDMKSMKDCVKKQILFKPIFNNKKSNDKDSPLEEEFES